MSHCLHYTHYVPMTLRLIVLKPQEGTFSDDQIQRIQKCTTRQDFEYEYKLFEEAYPIAAKYLYALDHDKTFLYKILDKGYTTHGHHTSNVVEITNNIIVEARLRDPYYLVDFMMVWHGKKIAERQGIGRELIKNKYLLTVYAARLLGKNENIARESIIKISAQGLKHYLVSIEEEVEGSTSTVTKRYNVNLDEKTCSCSFVNTHRIPCAHVIAVLDSLNLRDTVEGRETFRKEWIAPYFWTENYIQAYENEYVRAPEWDNSAVLQLPKGARVVTEPVIKKNHTKRNPIKRKTGSGGTRSRAVWNDRGFRKYKRRQGSRAGPANQYVRISNPDIFKKKPCGRKPLSRTQRSEGSVLARQQLMEAIKERQQNSSCAGAPSRAPSNTEVVTKRKRSKTRRSKRTRSKRSRCKRSQPDVSRNDSSTTPLPVFPVITQPEFPKLPVFPLTTPPNLPMITPLPFSPTPFGFPLLFTTL